MASSLPKQSFPQFWAPTFVPDILYARLTSLAACKNDTFSWNATPWLGPFLTADDQLIVWDRLAREKNFQIKQKNLDATAILHLGTTQRGRQNIFLMFPNIDKSMKSLAGNQKIMQLWTDDIMNAALERAFPRRGTNSFKLIQLNSQALRVEAMEVDYDIPIIVPLSGELLPQLWEEVQKIISAETHLSRFKDMVLFAFSAQESPYCVASTNGGSFEITSPFPMKSAEEVLDDELNKLDEFMDMAYVEKETLHIRGEFRFHVKEQEERSELRKKAEAVAEDHPEAMNTTT